MHARQHTYILHQCRTEHTLVHSQTKKNLTNQIQMLKIRFSFLPSFPFRGKSEEYYYYYRIFWMHYVCIWSPAANLAICVARVKGRILFLWRVKLETNISRNCSLLTFNPEKVCCTFVFKWEDFSKITYFNVMLKYAYYTVKSKHYAFLWLLKEDRLKTCVDFIVITIARTILCSSRHHYYELPHFEH